MTWQTEAKETLEFHEKMQKEHGKGKQGRPESISGKKGWGIRDTAKAKGISYKYAYDLLCWGKALKENPNFLRTIEVRSNRHFNLEMLLGTLKAKILILKSDKRTQKIGDDLEKALKDYES